MASSAPTIVEIELRKGQSGLGFNIRGGIDNVHIGTDPGIFVTTIKPNGAAAKDGTLRIGDKILEVNGTSLRQVSHREAVRCFQDTGDVIKMVVETGAEARIEKMLKEQKSPVSVPTEAIETTQSDGGDAQRFSNKRMLFAAVIVVAAVGLILAFGISRPSISSR
eukprot:Em0019g628a